MAKKRLKQTAAPAGGDIFVPDAKRERYHTPEQKVRRILSSRGRAANEINLLTQEEIAALEPHCDGDGTVGLDAPAAFAEVWLAVEKRRKRDRGRELPPPVGTEPTAPTV